MSDICIHCLKRLGKVSAGYVCTSCIKRRTAPNKKVQLALLQAENHLLRSKIDETVPSPVQQVIAKPKKVDETVPTPNQEEVVAKKKVEKKVPIKKDDSIAKTKKDIPEGLKRYMEAKRRDKESI